VELAKCGIPVLCCKELPHLSRESGEESAYADTIARLCEEQDNVYLSETIEGFGDLLDERFPKKSRFVTLASYAPMVLSHVRVTENKETVVFLANMAKEDLSTDVSFRAKYDTVCIANAHTGEITPLEATVRDTSTTVSLSIPSGEGVFILLK
jgi:hypothetical protein